MPLTIIAKEKHMGGMGKQLTDVSLHLFFAPTADVILLK
jgi:hypothetical protein